MFIQGDVRFGGVGCTIEYSVTGFGYVDFEAVSVTILYCGVYRVADAGGCGGEVADFIRKLYGRDREVVEGGGGFTVVTECKYKVCNKEVE